MAQIGEPAPLQVAVARQVQVEQACRATRALVSALDFGPVGSEMVVLAVSELATNLSRYARNGRIVVTPIAGGIQVESRDDGPGLGDYVVSNNGGRSRGGGLGQGLAGVQRLMDEFELDSGPDGTTVVCRKWRRAA